MIYTSPLSLHTDVRSDLVAIHAASPNAYARLLALLSQVRADGAILQKLLDHGFGDGRTEEISINKWLGQWRSGKNLWRMKSWEMEKLGLHYRVIYLYLPREARFVVMAIVERGSFDYDDKNHPVRKRIDASLQKTYGIG